MSGKKTFLAFFGIEYILFYYHCFVNQIQSTKNDKLKVERS